VPEKKKQHLVPKCYLKAFIDPTPPKGVPVEKYEPCTWVVDKSLEGKPKRKGLNNKMFWEPYFYNLDEDILSQPYVENFLAVIETNYSTAIRKIVNNEQITMDDWDSLAVFIDTLFRRSEGQVEHWQKQINEIERVYRLVDHSHNGNENVSNEYFLGSHELAKRMVRTATGTISNLISLAGISIVKNNSNIPFFTSDHPVTYIFTHIDNLLEWGIPKLWVYDHIGTNEKKFFCFCPLTPSYALISSPFIKPSTKGVFRSENSYYFSFGMNFLTHHNAKSVLISSSSIPYKNYQDHAIKVIKFLNKTASTPEGEKLIIYTNNARYSIIVSRCERIDDHPMYPKIKFWTENLKAVQIMANDQKVDLVEFYQDRKETGGTRNMKFTFVSINPNEPSILEANW